MFLTKVELNGFKSFADKTDFAFDEGITAVLGPNGCGKSNVVDAIKWVLGETSAKNLRGTQMLDVIFAGSEGRRPGSMAEVNLYFDNSAGKLPSDYNEVCITRRIYRSGESEYLINRQPCRRRDIRELFMDTGVGTSAYSVIEQGRVEALLAAKPQERRMVFEEAAGVSKYKSRRKETLSRLERCNQYLLRVNDIVDEVEKNIRRVSRQAAAAKRFQELKAELDTLKTDHYVRLYRQQVRQLEHILSEKAQIEMLLAQESGRQAENASRLAGLTARETELAGVEESRQNAFQEKQEALSRVQVEQTAAAEQLRSLERESQDAGGRIAALERRLEELAAAETTARADLESARARLEAAAAELRGQEETRAAAVFAAEAAERTVEECRRRLAERTEARSRLESDAARTESEESSLTGQTSGLDRREAELAAEEEALRADCAKVEAELRELETHVQDAARQAEESRELERARRAEAEKLVESLGRLNAERSAKQARLGTLRDLEHSLAGAFAGVKAVMTAWKNGEDSCREIRGLVADLLTVPADVALAIETTLGGQSQDVVVDTAYGAQKCIEYLKRSREGRATFLPLDRIRSRERLRRNLAHLPGVLGEAIDLVKYDSEFKSVMEYLLAGVLVVENLDIARQVSAGDARGVRIVTLEGDVINPYGAMTGGNNNQKAGGLIMRKAEMDELGAELAELERRREKEEKRRGYVLLEMQDALGKANEAEKLRRERDAAGQEIRQKVAAARSSLDRLVRDRERLGADKANLAGTLAELTRRRETIAAEREQIAQVLTALEQELIATQEAHRAARVALDAGGEELATKRVRQAEAQAQFDELTRRLADLDRDRAERAAELERSRLSVTEAGDRRRELEQTLSELREREAALLIERDAARQAMGALREELAEVRERLQEERDQERAAQRRLTEIQTSLSDFKVRENECRLRLQNVSEKAKEELSVENLDERAAEQARLEAEAEANAAAQAAVQAEDGTPAGEVRAVLDEAGLLRFRMTDEQIATLIRDVAVKIERIGPVNLCAIEELTELEARREFLVSEQEDLQQAAQDLLGVIERLNDECARRFNETFEMVRDNFRDLFGRLFGGGTADLILQEPSPEEKTADADPGIEIIARPPGKAPKSISLLSGGEKALCAVALLLAIFRSKPSPFCILDEVDGPLDESNIDRFMEAIKEFSRETQFILISHSKRTMSMTDTIYGVTQNEPGVSTKYSLRFRQAEPGEKSGEPSEELVGAAAG